MLNKDVFDHSKNPKGLGKTTKQVLHEVNNQRSRCPFCGSLKSSVVRDVLGNLVWCTCYSCFIQGRN